MELVDQQPYSTVRRFMDARSQIHITVFVRDTAYTGTQTVQRRQPSFSCSRIVRHFLSPKLEYPVLVAVPIRRRAMEIIACDVTF